MEIIDLDGLFEEKLAAYMKRNAGKYSEKEWEELIPKLYKKFAGIEIPRLKNTPVGYYAAMTDGELCSALRLHSERGVPVSDFLMRELERRGCTDPLIALLDSGDEQLLSRVVSIAGGDRRAVGAYFRLLERDLSDDLSEAIIGELRRTDGALAGAIDCYKRGIRPDRMLGILAEQGAGNDEVFSLLLSDLRGGDDLVLAADRIATLGDARALPDLYELIARDDIDYLEFRELRYAIEALGGEYTEERDFSEDASYLALKAHENEEIKKQD